MQERFTTWLAQLPKGKASRIYVVCDSDGDGLPAGALLLRALREAGYTDVDGECRRKGESAWGEEIGGRLRERAERHGIDAVIVADLGSRDGVILRQANGITPLLLIDHHRPIGQPEGSTLITAYGTGDPAGDGKDIATTGLLCWWCARALVGEEKASEWLWLAGISITSDLGDKAPFEELAAAKSRFGGGALRDATSLLNAPRRTNDGRADAALALLVKANGPKEVTSGVHPETAELQRAKEEVGEALAIARKQPPRFSKAVREELGADLVAIRMHTGCQVHPLVAQQWRGRFAKSVVFGVNTGYRPGWVSFSGRAPAGVNLIEFLARHRPPEADTTYGLGHNQASGGSLPVPIWNRWIQEIGFGREMVVEEAGGSVIPGAVNDSVAELAEAGE
ncbi:MAG: DHH family phosphoesterase [Janthinobacterium lividum]